MKKYICEKCKSVVEDWEIGYHIESYGERLRNDTCDCGGDLIPAKECKICGEIFNAEDLIGKVCEGCIEEHETIKNVLNAGDNDTQSVEINGFVASVLTEKQINEILVKWVEENFTDHSVEVVKYCKQDELWFSEFLEEKYGGD